MRKYPSDVPRKNNLLLFFIAIHFLWISLGMNKEAESQGSYKENPPVTKELFSRGETLYQKQCSVCHGPQGKGDGKAAYLLSPKPRDFVGDKFRFISTTNQQATDEDLFKVITRGMAGSSMPPWAHLRERDRWALVYYVRYLSEADEFKESGKVLEKGIKNEFSWNDIKEIVNKQIASENIIKIPPEPEVTQETLVRGRELFVVSCAGCHGLQGRGDGQQNMTDSQGLPTKPRDLTAGIFKSDSSSEELYFRMMAGMPGTPMPSYNGVFTQEQIWDLIHFVQTLTTPEAEARARLKQTTINSKKINLDINPDPLWEEWSKIEPISIGLTPLWWRDERIEKVDVKVVYNQDKMAIYLSWNDPIQDDDVVAMQAFSDGAALQFSMKKDPPFFGMGNPQDSVYMWHWKSGWQNTTDGRKDIESRYPNIGTDWYSSDKHYQHGEEFDPKESSAKYHDPQFLTAWGAGNPVADVEKTENAEQAVAAGQGTYKAYPAAATDVDANGVWKDGRWHVVFVRSLKVSNKKDLQLDRANTVSIAFAIWDGSAHDRNGQKSVSIWNELVIGK
ncbi:MAG TPA: c-type cytochrome [Candidatus Omnitrophota bacterium]|nr:c-type cytochrome [Candidatus Omnitrophota bacterium]